MRIPKTIPPIKPCVNLKITLLTFGEMVVSSTVALVIILFTNIKNNKQQLYAVKLL